MLIPAFDDRRLYLLLTRSLCSGKPLEVLEAALGAGVDLIQIREKPFAVDALTWIDDVRERAQRYQVPILVNDRVDLALQSGAVGVHLGQEDLRLHAEGSLRERSFALGLSTHDPTEMARALRERPDYVGVGPCFATRTKGYEEGLQPGALESLLAQSPVPAYGIGGIDPDNLPELMDRGLRHIAVSSCILGASEPAQVTRALRRLLDSG